MKNPSGENRHPYRNLHRLKSLTAIATRTTRPLVPASSSSSSSISSSSDVRINLAGLCCRPVDIQVGADDVAVPREPANADLCVLFDSPLPFQTPQHHLPVSSPQRALSEAERWPLPTSSTPKESDSGSASTKGDLSLYKRRGKVPPSF